MLNQYDVVGPVIAKCILNDEDSQELCKKLSSDFLADIIFMLKEGNYEMAIEKYKKMIALLFRIYYKDITEYAEKQKIKVKKY